MELKMKLKMVAGALVFGIASHASALPIDLGGTGNGDLWFSLASSSQSYTRNLNVKLDTFNTSATTVAGYMQDFTADATLTSFLAGVADKSTLFWSVTALDAAGQRRIVTTYSEPMPATRKTNDVIRSAGGDIQQWLNGANEKLTVTDSATYTASDNGFANKTDALGRPFQPDIYTKFNFDTRSSMGTGTSMLDVMRIDAAATGIAASTYNRYFDPNAIAIQFRLEQNGNLQVSAVPEPDTYALLLAGLGMVGFIARRRLNRVAA